MIENVILTLDKTFKDIQFDIEEVEFSDGSKKFCIIVGDFDFYMGDLKFKKIIKIFRLKYPKLKWFCCYKKID